jgi:hypothetical protein
MPYTDLLTDEQVLRYASNFANGLDTRLTFANRKNRDAVARRVKQLSPSKAARMVRRSHRNQLYDPRYTVEGQIAGLTDQGFANDYKHYHPALYMLELDRW